MEIENCLGWQGRHWEKILIRWWYKRLNFIIHKQIFSSPFQKCIIIDGSSVNLLYFSWWKKFEKISTVTAVSFWNSRVNIIVKNFSSSNNKIVASTTSFWNYMKNEIHQCNRSMVEISSSNWIQNQNSASQSPSESEVAFDLLYYVKFNKR